jgi:regulator of protease activity HflC (stomatin/prohibitin superfamily)
MSVRSDGGWYIKNFATVKTYPKSVQAFFSSDEREGGKEDDSIRATFNDGGTADVSTIVRFRMPTEESQRLLVHREFGADMKTVEDSVRAHLVNCIKATATMMTASENQTSRKAEFAKVIGDQLQNGLYRFQRIEVPVIDFDGTPKRDNKGVVITAWATEIVKDKDGNPIIDAVSPLNQYGITVSQFSVTSVDYDPQTRDQFAKKKDASLKAELAKIQVEQAKQETTKVEEEGKRLVAQKNAEMNVQIAESEGKAKMLVAKAQQEKLEAKEAKEKAEIDAEKLLSVAKLEREAAEEQAKRIILLAEAKQKEIELAGNITEREKVLAEIECKRHAMGMEAIAKYVGPKSVIMTGGSNSGGTGSELMEALGLNAMIDLSKKLDSDLIQ